MHRVLLDRYVQGRSPVHRLDPRVKLLATLAFVLAATSIPPRAWLAFSLLTGVAMGTVWLAGMPVTAALKRSLIALPFAGTVALSVPFTRGGQVLWAWGIRGWQIQVTAEGMLLFIAVVVKSWLSVLISGLLVATTRFPDLLVGLRALGLPGVLVAIVSFTYRYLHVLVAEALRMHTAREARSVGAGGTLRWRVRVLGGMIGALFIRSYERSERVYAAMLARGYDGQIRALTHPTWQARDAWAGLLWGGMLAVIVILARALPGIDL
jgi:cobalt/nickel transport system permease protein